MVVKKLVVVLLSIPHKARATGQPPYFKITVCHGFKILTVRIKRHIVRAIARDNSVRAYRDAINQ